MLNYVPCAILLYVTFGVVQSRFVYKQDIQREIKQEKVIATWQEAKEHCESQGAILASPIDSTHLNYMRSYIDVNDHTSAYFTGYKTVIQDDVLNYISVEGFSVDDLPEVVIDMIEKIDPEDGDCLSMDRHEIRAVSCWKRLPYICYTKVTNANLNEPMEVPSSAPNAVNTEARSVVLPELQSGEPTNVIQEVAANVSIETSSSEVVKVIPVEPTRVPVNVITDVIPDESIKVSSGESVDVATEVTTKSTEVSSRVPVEVTTDDHRLVTIKIMLKPKVMLPIQVETTEVSIDVQINNTHEEEDLNAGYSFYETGSFYKLHEAPLPWTNANATCVSEGGYLAVINDEAELLVLLGLGDVYPHVLWTGLKKIDGLWRSVQDDNVEDIYNRWSVNRADQTCGVIINTSLLDDRDCDYTFPYICEKNIAPIEAEA